ncbi:hypothetical protein [Bacillus toyonensis]|uniref:hypothetical protein n=1 Tax=Bacillus toyonensis TaxID=155322 RepID=UPI000BF3EA37|nr:hypothetical protein [Bacillus toyonensis]PGF05123.1 hypothetical protein COM61_01485 [Bacillus toyonensis]
MLNFTEAVVKHIQKHINIIKDINAEEERVITDLKFVIESNRKVNDMLGVFEAEEKLLNKRLEFNNQKKTAWSNLQSVVSLASDLDVESQMKQMIASILEGKGL